MRVLVACEFSGVVREAFASRGHDAWSCDLLPAADGALRHIHKDITSVLRTSIDWDIIIAHPPCTYLCSSGLHWNKRDPERQEKTEAALALVRWFLELPIEHIAVENPVGCISTRIRKPDQIIHPHQFGHDASKATCLWLKNLPALRPTGSVEPRIVSGLPRWSNQTDSGQNRLAPSADRWAERSKTYQGIADAMAEQWGALN
jgi:site-specific DNA-cytosine methylase